MMPLSEHDPSEEANTHLVGRKEEEEKGKSLKSFMNHADMLGSTYIWELCPKFTLLVCNSYLLVQYTIYHP